MEPRQGIFTTTSSSSSSTSPSSSVSSSCPHASERVDSPTDSGIESGKEHCNGSVCSSPRSALEDKVKDMSDSESNEKHEADSVSHEKHHENHQHHSVDHSMPKQTESMVVSEKLETIEDMPMLKRALQAPPLINANMLMDEAYRHHKKFRATKREEKPSTTTPDQLASTHSTLVQALERAPFLTDQQLKKTDLIHKFCMRQGVIMCPPNLSSPPQKLVVAGSSDPNCCQPLNLSKPRATASPSTSTSNPTVFKLAF